MEVCAGLDLSLRSAGVAVILQPGNVVYRTFGYGIDSKSTERDRIERVIHIADSIMGVLNKYGARNVGVENYGFATKGKIALQAELSGVIKTQLLLSKKLPVVLSANAIRKYLLGKATKDKKVVRAALVALGYPPPGNLDESDALAVAHVVSGWANYRAGEANSYRTELFEAIDYNLMRTARSGG